MKHQESSQTEPHNRVIFFDTTLRDGDQAPGYAMTVKEKLKMAHALATMGVDVIEAGFPVSSDLDFRAIKAIVRKVDGPRIAALARTNKRDIEYAASALEECARPRIHTFIATSEEHMKYKLGKTPDQVLQMIDENVGLASDYMKGRGDVEWSAEDASRSSLGFLIEAVKGALNAGATTINLPDTVGYAKPSEYENMFRQVIAKTHPAPDIVFSAHTHNDLGLANANALAALDGGAKQIECTVKGIGERAGNAQFEAIVANLIVRRDAYPYTCPQIDTHFMKPAADLLTSFFSNAPSIHPVVGDNAPAHGSGIHQDGTLKSGCYDIMNPLDYGHKGTKIQLTRHSGQAGVMEVLEKRGIILPPEESTAFMHVFKTAASQALENDHLRVIPPALAENWAHAWSPRQKNCVIAKPPLCS